MGRFFYFFIFYYTSYVWRCCPLRIKCVNLLINQDKDVMLAIIPGAVGSRKVLLLAGMPLSLGRTPAVNEWKQEAKGIPAKWNRNGSQELGPPGAHQGDVVKTVNRLHFGGFYRKGEICLWIRFSILQLSVEGAEMGSHSLGKWYLKALSNVYLQKRKKNQAWVIQ